MKWIDSPEAGFVCVGMHSRIFLYEKSRENDCCHVFLAFAHSDEIKTLCTGTYAQCTHYLEYVRGHLGILIYNPEKPNPPVPSTFGTLTAEQFRALPAEMKAELVARWL